MNRKLRRDTRPTALEQALSSVRRAFRIAESPTKAPLSCPHADRESDGAMSALACMRKKKFANESLAMSAIYRMRARNQDTELLHTYECGFCKHWHLGHKPRVQLPPPVTSKVYNE